MTDSEKLDLLLQKSTVLESEVGTLREDMEEMKESQSSLKQDMKDMETSIRQDMKDMETSIRQDMKDMETSIRQDMKDMEISIRQDMKDMETSIRQDMKDMETSMRQDVEDMETSIRQDMKDMETSIRQDITEIKADVSSLREEVHLTIENEVRPNINIIAEGHLELARKLNECIHLCSDIKSKQEICDVFINLHKHDRPLTELG